MSEIKRSVFDEPDSAEKRRANRQRVGVARASRPRWGHGLASAVPIAERTSTGRKRPTREAI